MTRTLRERIGKKSFLPHARAFEGRIMKQNYRRDAADMAASLRSLATRAHEAVKAFESRKHRPGGHELAELLAAIHELENDFRAQNLDDLVPYVTALRQQVETRLV